MMKKRVIPFFIAVFGAFAMSFMSLNCSAQSENGISVSKNALSAGEEFVLTVKVPPAENADTATVRVTFDKDTFEITAEPPDLPGSMAGIHEDDFIIIAANAERSIDLSGGLVIPTGFKVKDSAVSGNYTFTLAEASFCWYSDETGGFVEVWFPETTEVEVTVDGISAEPAEPTETTPTEQAAPEQTASAAAQETEQTAADTTKAAAQTSARISSDEEGHADNAAVSSPDSFNLTQKDTLIYIMAGVGGAAVIVIIISVVLLKNRK